ncbi:hypothetical protein NCS56_00680900 [Fusarium sp. Ph1]|nr:hypothetical protein NCS56_00680900 [Fusarium sp. Ph1]
MVTLRTCAWRLGSPQFGISYLPPTVYPRTFTPDYRGRKGLRLPTHRNSRLAQLSPVDYTSFIRMGGNSLITCSVAELDGQQRLEITESPAIPLSTTESDHDSNLAHGSCYNDTSCTQDDISLADSLEEELIRETGAIELVNECREEASLAGTGLFADQDIARFEERFLAAVTEMVEYPRRVPSPDYKQLPRAQRAMSTAFYTIFNTSSPTSITALLLGTVPTCVRKALGGVQPTFGDLLALPEPTIEQKASWIVYFDGTVRWEMEDDPKDPLQRWKTDRIVRRGKYVGSSVDCRCGGTRLDRHISVAITKRSVESRQLHHAELCEQGTEANLRILAAFDRDPRCKPYGPSWDIRWKGKDRTIQPRSLLRPL